MAEESLHDTFSGATKGLFGTIGFLLLMFGGELVLDKQDPRSILGSVLCAGGATCFYMVWAGKTIRKRLPDESIRRLNNIAGDPRWWLATLLTFVISIALWRVADVWTASDPIGIQAAAEAQKITLIEWLQRAQRERNQQQQLSAAAPSAKAVPSVGSARLADLSNEQLREDALTFIKELRKFEAGFQLDQSKQEQQESVQLRQIPIEDRSASQKKWDENVAARQLREDQHRAQYNLQFRQQALSYGDAI